MFSVVLKQNKAMFWKIKPEKEQIRANCRKSRENLREKDENVLKNKRKRGSNAKKVKKIVENAKKCAS
ncbi:MAG: hypothetical protein ACLUD0_14480 [Eubacterium ramulus]